MQAGLPLLPFLVVLLGVICPANTLGLMCQSVQAGGSWLDPNTWTNCNGTIPGPQDYATIGQGIAAFGPVTIDSTASVQVASVRVYSSTLYIKGNLSTPTLDVSDSKVVCTGHLELFNSDNSSATLLSLFNSNYEHHGDLVIGGQSASEVQILCLYSTMSVSGSLQADSLRLVRTILYEGSIDVEGSVLLVGGATSTASSSYVGFLDPWSSGLSFYISTVQIKGSLDVWSRTGQPKVVGGSSGNVSLVHFGSTVQIGGDLSVQSGDAAAGGKSGNANLVTESSAFGINAASSLIVGGSFYLSTGSGGQAGDGGVGGDSGLARMSLTTTTMTVNNAGSQFVVLTGSGGNGVTSGGRGGDANVTIGYGSSLTLVGPMQLIAGNGGSGSESGGAGGSSSINFAYGGDLRVKTDVTLLAGNGGNATASTSTGGNGGVSGVLILRSGTTLVERNVVITSGYGGNGANGGMAGPSYTLASEFVPTAVETGDDSIAKRSTTRPLALQVGQDLKLTSNRGGNGFNGYGGNCSLSFPSQLLSAEGGVILNVFGADMSIGRHVIIDGCSGGNGVSAPGGRAGAVGLAVMGSTVSVGGNISVTGGNGGSVTGGSDDGGAGAEAFLRGSTASTLNVTAVFLSSGTGGSVINGTGSGGSVSVGYQTLSTTVVGTGIFIQDASALTVGGGNGHVYIYGGESGGVDAERNEGALTYAGSTGPVGLEVQGQGSSITCGDVSLIGGKMGNVRVHEITDVTKRTVARGEKSDLVYYTALGASMHGKAVFNGDFTAIGTNGGTNDLVGGSSGGMAYFGSTAFGDIQIKGKVYVKGGDGALGNGTKSGGNGASALITATQGGVVTFTDAVLQGGAAGNGTNATLDGRCSIGQVYMASGDVNQYGLLSMRKGGARSTSTATPVLYATSVFSVSQGSTYVVFPCEGAGIEFPGNSSDFTLTLRGVFRDCRGAGAVVKYPQPTADILSNGTCAPCQCWAQFNSCPLKPSTSSASSARAGIWWDAILSLF